MHCQVYQKVCSIVVPSLYPMPSKNIHAVIYKTNKIGLIKTKDHNMGERGIALCACQLWAWQQWGTGTPNTLSSKLGWIGYNSIYTVHFLMPLHATLCACACVLDITLFCYTNWHYNSYMFRFISHEELQVFLLYIQGISSSVVKDIKFNKRMTSTSVYIHGRCGSQWADWWFRWAAPCEVESGSCPHQLLVLPEPLCC